MSATIRNITRQWLKDNGYDGLCQADSYCGCELDNLMPCEEPSPECQAGYKVPCPGEGTCELGGDCPFHITIKKPASRQKRSMRDLNRVAARIVAHDIPSKTTYEREAYVRTQIFWYCQREMTRRGLSGK